jgi:hypothetical protein
MLCKQYRFFILLFVMNISVQSAMAMLAKKVEDFVGEVEKYALFKDLVAHHNSPQLSEELVDLQYTENRLRAEVLNLQQELSTDVDELTLNALKTIMIKHYEQRPSHNFLAGVPALLCSPLSNIKWLREYGDAYTLNDQLLCAVHQSPNKKALKPYAHKLRVAKRYYHGCVVNEVQHMLKQPAHRLRSRL